MFREDPEVYIMNSAFELAGDSNRVFTLFWQIRLGEGVFASQVSKLCDDYLDDVRFR